MEEGTRGRKGKGNPSLLIPWLLFLLFLCDFVFHVVSFPLFSLGYQSEDKLHIQLVPPPFLHPHLFSLSFFFVSLSSSRSILVFFWWWWQTFFLYYEKRKRGGILKNIYITAHFSWESLFLLPLLIFWYPSLLLNTSSFDPLWYFLFLPLRTPSSSTPKILSSNHYCRSSWFGSFQDDHHLSVSDVLMTSSLFSLKNEKFAKILCCLWLTQVYVLCFSKRNPSPHLLLSPNLLSEWSLLLIMILFRVVFRREVPYFTCQVSLGLKCLNIQLGDSEISFLQFTKWCVAPAICSVDVCVLDSRRIEGEMKGW